MKRPEGFDRAPSAPSGSRARRSPAGRAEAGRGSADPSAPSAPDRRATATATLDRPGHPDRAADRAEPRRLEQRDPQSQPVRVPSAKAELRAAARARRREEKAEIRRFTRRSRRRRLAWLSAAVVVVTLAGMVVAAVYSPLLALRHIRVEGTSRLNASQVRDAVDSQLGTPLALLDTAKLTRELGEFSLIRSYSTEIVPPDTVVIRIVERTPVGALQSSDGYELVDAAGVTVASSQARPTGVPLIDLAPSQGVDSAGFAAMARVITSLPADLAARVDTVSATSGDDVRFTITGTSQTVVWGGDERAQQKAQTLARMPEYIAGQAGTFDVASVGIATYSAS